MNRRPAGGTLDPSCGSRKQILQGTRLTYTSLFCDTLCCTALPYTALHVKLNALYCTVLHYIILPCPALHRTAIPYQQCNIYKHSDSLAINRIFEGVHRIRGGQELVESSDRLIQMFCFSSTESFCFYTCPIFPFYIGPN